MKATVLGIGTELVDGQIVNKNAAWISKKLKNHGLQTTLHLVVPDERKLMREGIELCATHSDWVFITGGLGPTSDDFTREVVAEWAGLPLDFHQPSWDHLSERLTSRGYTVKEIQRQQCFFPRGAEVLKNAQGTANAFTFTAHGKKLFVLPGPPREIESVWDDYIETWVQAQTAGRDPFITRTWDTLGYGESDIAVIVEDVLKGVTVEKGYRVHLPYVEVKLSYFQSEEKKLQPTLTALDKALDFCTIIRDHGDVAALLIESFKNISSLCVVDEVTGQFLINRLLPGMRDFMSKNEWSFSKTRFVDVPAQLHLAILPMDEHTCEVRLEQNGRVVKDFVTTPYKTANMKERRHQYFAEMALIFWHRHLNT